MSQGFDLWRAIDAEGGAPNHSDWCRGVNAGLEAASKHVERLGYFEGDIVLPKETVAALLEALIELVGEELGGDAHDKHRPHDCYQTHISWETRKRARAALAAAGAK